MMMILMVKHAVRPFFFLVRFKEDNFSERGPCRMVLGQEC